jgi:hypothetical protein
MSINDALTMTDIPSMSPSMVSGVSTDASQAASDSEIRALKDRHDHLLDLVFSNAERHCVTYNEGSVLHMSTQHTTARDVYTSCEVDDVLVLISYRDDGGGEHYKCHPEYRHTNVMPDDTGQLSIVIRVDKIQPNKELLTKHSIVCTWTRSALRVPYHHHMIISPIDLASIIMDRTSIKPIGCPYVERDIKTSMIRPSLPIRCDVLLTVLMMDRDLSRYMHPRDNGAYSTNPKCKLVCTFNSRRYIITVSNSRINSLALCKKYNMTYLAPSTIAKVSRVSSIDDVIVLSGLFNVLLRKYEENRESVSELLDSLMTYDEKFLAISDEGVTRMKLLRGQSMDLFAQRYSRECPIMPHVIDEQHVEMYRGSGRSIIRYPDNEDGKYYMAPVGYFVGLKLNRLRNSWKYPLIVLCYLKDHSLDPNTHTYRYLSKMPVKRDDADTGYISKVKRLKPWRRGVIPQYISNVLMKHEASNMVRLGLPKHPLEFLAALADHEKVICGHLSMQEMWDRDIYAELVSCTSYDMLFRMYRLVEDLIDATIIILTSGPRGLSVEIPVHADHYVWRNRYSKLLAIAHTRINEYEVVYEIVCRDCDDMYLHVGDRVYEELLGSAARCLTLPVSSVMDNCLMVDEVEAMEHDIVLQYINSRGITVMIQMANGDILQCYTRPIRCAYEMIECSNSILCGYISRMGDQDNMDHQTMLSDSRHVVLHGRSLLSKWVRHDASEF